MNPLPDIVTSIPPPSPDVVGSTVNTDTVYSKVMLSESATPLLTTWTHVTLIPACPVPKVHVIVVELLNVTSHSMSPNKTKFFVVLVLKPLPYMVILSPAVALVCEIEVMAGVAVGLNVKPQEFG